ncbi:malate synthase [Virgibacillus sp. NKC19-16]|uniref:malate synthase n=1 Tax=Virgibacillus salidurans TaxID=2831673 RepID=UPI001F3F1585|nr:malate synthase [Virgibacillus sp. NKC19-16]UJL47747.1 malate synthase [Virgibacillus sp. NKC19-16]
MNLINEEITHKVFGEGNIVDQDASFVTISFNEDIKKFVYPDAFGSFITLNDRDTAKSLKKILSQREMEEEALEKRRAEEKERQVLEQQRREKLKNLKIHESSQIVFWLDEEEQQNVFTDWQVYTGTVQSGKNKGQPNRVTRVSPNSAGLLTARESDQAETERRIIGLYMVNETFSGNFHDDGMVPAHAEFRIKLNDQEAEKMLFWNYYINKSYPHRTSWNSGKYRYFDNVWTAQILKDIIALKTDEKEIKETTNFLEYFCQMNALDMDNIPEAKGALKQ